MSPASPPSENVPASHAAHTAAPPSLEKPGAQGTQTSPDVAPDTLLAVPGPQREQSDTKASPSYERRGMSECCTRCDESFK